MFGRNYVGAERLPLGLAGLETGAASVIQADTVPAPDQPRAIVTGALRAAGPAATKPAGPGFTLSA